MVNRTAAQREKLTTIALSIPMLIRRGNPDAASLPTAFAMSAALSVSTTRSTAPNCGEKMKTAI
ncbi:hypothetical protein LV75_001400 [Actinokineospora diospyrosa]|uniref:Uncharacterized protein n=1 Tax=Actinokineospora diospyrosa TaxID=103728 RepID=A0ABT1I8G3_9PSEU|nr:hypothetical protein [Actinokineospora diospyrosa]